MRTLFNGLLISSVLSLVGCAASSSEVSQVSGQAWRDTFSIESSADWEVDYSWDGKLDIGVGVSKGGIWYAKTFDLDELKSFWTRQRHKDFVVVMLPKNTWDDVEYAEVCRKLKAYFFKVGFKRVRIQQAASFGVGVVSDDTTT